MQQTSIIPAGCQRWNKNVIDSGGDHFVYCSTISAYVHGLSGSNSLEYVNAAHDATITGVTWCKQDTDFYATSSIDMKVTKWNIAEEKEVASVEFPSKPLQIDWCPQENSSIAVMTKSGEVYIWDSFRTQDPLIGPLEKLPKGICSIRWSGGKKVLLACGTSDGTLFIWDKQTDGVSCIPASEQCEGLAITDMQWDPLSNQFIVVQYIEGCMSLVSVEDKRVVKEFSRTKNTMEMAAFLPNLPGQFITATKKSSNLTFWNVSQTLPVRHLKIIGKDGGGVTAFKISTSDNTKFLVSFTDGAVGVWCCIQEKLIFCTPGSHSETIFDVKYKYSSPTVCATVSFDGSLKIWDTVLNKCISNLMDQKVSMLYSISWCPSADPEQEWRVMVGSANGEVVMWDTRGAGKKLATYTHHIEPVFKVHWNPLDPTLIASASTDCSCVIFNTHGKVIQTFAHPGPVYCVDWHPTNPNWLVTGCHDGVVRCFDVSNSTAKPFAEFSGHTARVFTVCWSPLLKDAIASGGDDRTVRIFTLNVPVSKRMLVLSGHTHNIRALSWNYEIPWLLSSGSWDSTIRVWDIRAIESLRCVHIAYQHMADVYGMATHPEKPFTYVTTSRDTSIRFWTLTHQVIPLLHSTLLLNGQLDPDKMSTVKESMVVDTPAALCGAASQRLNKRLVNEKDVSKTIPTFFNFCINMPGLQELWALAESIVTESKSSNEVVPHLNDLRKRYLDKANQLRDIKFDLGGSKPSVRTQEAADILLALGDVKEYCNIMVELGEWERAIAIAPCYSMSFWQELSVGYAEYLRSKGNINVIPFYVATGSIDQLVAFQSKQNNLRGALLTTVTDAMDKYPRPQDEEEEPKDDTDPSKREEVYPTPRIQDTINKLGALYQKVGEPIFAASYHLANGDNSAAVRSLYCGDCIELAYALTKVAKFEDVDYIYIAMSRRCEQTGNFHNAYHALSEMSNDPQRELNLLAIRFTGKTREIEDFYTKCGCESPASYTALADAAEEGSIEELKHAIMARDFVRAGETGISILHDELTAAFTKGGTLPWETLKEVVDYLNCLNLIQLKPELRAEILCYSYYVAMQESMWKNYSNLIPFLVETIKTLIFTYELELAIPFSMTKLQEATYFQVLDAPYALQCVNECLEHAATLPAKAKNSVGTLKKTIETVVDIANSPDKVVDTEISVCTSSHECYPAGIRLPGASTRKYPIVSIISRSHIMGARVMLEDMESAISQQEAVMFAQVCPFSPLATGERLNPNRFEVFPSEVVEFKNIEKNMP